MFMTLYRVAIRLLGVLNAFPTKLTEKIEILALIERLRPVKTESPLVRLGPDGDGGYLVPDDFVGIEACFSPGVSTVSGFEKSCAEMGMKVFLADGSVACPADDDELFEFKKVYIGAISGNGFLTLDEWVSSSMPGTNSDLLLQMDIEGYEWVTFLSTPRKVMNRFRMIVVEFHKMDQLWSKPFFSLAQPAIDRILETHKCVHIHPNNSSGDFKMRGISLPPTMEFTFIRKDRAAETSFCRSFPHPLDRDNTDRASVVLSECWYASN